MPRHRCRRAGAGGQVPESRSAPPLRGEQDLRQRRALAGSTQGRFPGRMTRGGRRHDGTLADRATRGRFWRVPPGPGRASPGSPETRRSPDPHRGSGLRLAQFARRRPDQYMSIRTVLRPNVSAWAISRRNRRPMARCRGKRRRSRRPRSAAHGWQGPGARRRWCRHRWPRCQGRIAGHHSSRYPC